MQRITGFLNKFSNITPPDDTLRSEAVRIIKKETHIPIKKEQITLRGKTLFLSLPAVQKNEVFLKKHLILKNLNQTLGSGKVQKII